MRYLFVLLLAGCAMYTKIDYTRPPPADWPKMAEKLMRVSEADVLRLCQDATHGTKGCARADFGPRVCYLIVADDIAVEHERGHCAGYDHAGSTATADAWERYKARGGK